MKVFVTGNLGYIGKVLTEELAKKGHEATGCDTGYFLGEDYVASESKLEKQLIKDVRDVAKEDLKGFDAVMHLAALSNDPLGELNPLLTSKINTDATVKLAEIAKEAGVEKFIFSSSCSIYGQTSGGSMNEESSLNPVSVYAQEKIISEWRLSRLADKKFAPVYLRNATAFGVSPRMRFDLVVNNLEGHAYTSGKIKIMSDGKAYRPIVHIRDISKAFILASEAKHDLVFNKAFNVGSNSENYRVKEIAEKIHKQMPGTQIEILGKNAEDKRSYKVDFSKIQDMIGFEADWPIEKGVGEIYDSFKKKNFDDEEFNNPRYITLKWMKKLMDEGKVDAELRWLK